MTKTFPLLKLPLLVQQHIIRTMDCHSTITFSMGSQKMKSLVRRLNFRAKRFRTYVGNNEIRVTSNEAHIDVKFWLEENEPDSFLAMGMLWDCKARKLRDWMNHLKYIYNCDRYGFLFIDGCEQFRVNFLREEFEQLEHEEIRLIETSDVYAIEVLQTFVPVKQLMISTDPFPTRDGLEIIICRPFDELVLHQHIPTTVIELININAIDIECWKCDMTEEDLNLFFRLWIHGEYSRLSYMFLKIVKADFDEIKAFEEMEYEMEKKPDDEIKKVYWIKSLDGGKASIRFSEWGECTDVKFKVQK
ncbi:hypothetical protein CAEBREN_14337 [Caenorhabditis brenneri]|uniref:F-box domain-containing protein n=1 Tax=Caenorhabditis brenneri TaxID=135651 RepID=G0NSC7_CAEBE|nr:hypothetical protein CAEBREN_14337 [Caenorhabditis brenneri]